MEKRINRDDVNEQIFLKSVKIKTVGEDITPQQSLSPQPENVNKQPENQEIPQVEETQKVEIPVKELPESPKEENRSKRNSTQDYELLFIKETDLPPARFGKSVYIRKEYHERINHIISVIGSSEVSLFSYLDNIIAHHFDNFQEDIIKSYNRKNTNNIF